MRRINLFYYCALIVFTTVFTMQNIGYPVVSECSAADYGVLPAFEVDALVPAPPALRFAAPPAMVVVPSGQSSVYMAANMTGVYFYDGVWYRNYNGYWYRASRYNGRWSPVRVEMIPSVVVVVPPEYPRHLPTGYHRIRYSEFDRGWKSWGRDPDHWRRQEWFKRENNDGIRQERFSNIRGERENTIREIRDKRAGNFNNRPGDHTRTDTYNRPGDKGKPGELKPGAGHSGSGPLGIQRPAGNLQGSQRPADNNPGSKHLGTQRPADNRPAVKQPAVQQPRDNQFGNKPSGTQRPVNNQSGNKQPGTQRPVDNRPVVKQPAVQRPGDHQPGKQQNIQRPPVTQNRPAVQQPAGKQPPSQSHGDNKTGKHPGNQQ